MAATPPKSLIGRVRRVIRPAQGKQGARAYLKGSARFLNEEGFTKVSSLVMDDKSVFPPKGEKGGTIERAVEAGLEHLGGSGGVSQVILVAEGVLRGYHVVVRMNYRKRRYEKQPSLAVSVSALPLTAPRLGRPPKGVRYVDWFNNVMKPQADKRREERQALLDEFSAKLSAIFPKLPLKVTRSR